MSVAIHVWPVRAALRYRRLWLQQPPPAVVGSGVRSAGLQRDPVRIQTEVGLVPGEARRFAEFGRGDVHADVKRVPAVGVDPVALAVVVKAPGRRLRAEGCARGRL